MRGHRNANGVSRDERPKRSGGPPKSGGWRGRAQSAGGGFREWISCCLIDFAWVCDLGCADPGLWLSSWSWPGLEPCWPCRMIAVRRGCGRQALAALARRGDLAQPQAEQLEQAAQLAGHRPARGPSASGRSHQDRWRRTPTRPPLPNHRQRKPASTCRKYPTRHRLQPWSILLREAARLPSHRLRIPRRMGLPQLRHVTEIRHRNSTAAGALICVSRQPTALGLRLALPRRERKSRPASPGRATT